MSTPARKRLMRDFKRLQQDPPAGISGAPHDNNIMLWNAVIFGPKQRQDDINLWFQKSFNSSIPLAEIENRPTCSSDHRRLSPRLRCSLDDLLSPRSLPLPVIAVFCSTTRSVFPRYPFHLSSMFLLVDP
ncbi:hypothetical protein F2Q69_00026685 [Brassica cretica]|uniref:UBC core domain-containing protein n=1 Tax=Brassica cretica TaxID=69181 RepID=A0A8S9RWA3_BRACR|nr:hypothetical protein F2Q69_00026685 [Brassica cretica]